MGLKSAGWISLAVVIVTGLILLGLWLGGVISKTKNENKNPEEPLLDGAYVIYPDGSYKKISVENSETVLQTTSLGPKTAQELADAVFKQQRDAEFQPERIALLLYPGEHTLNIKLGYYTAVAGLGQTSAQVVVNGTITSINNDDPCIGALDNFFRSISNLTINVPENVKANFFCTSQASPLRDLVVNGDLGVAKFVDGCGGNGSNSGGYSSGGYMHNVRVNGTLLLETQQQFFTQNSKFDSFSGGAWNVFFMGCEGKINTTPCLTGAGKTLVKSANETSSLSAAAPLITYDLVMKKFVVFRPTLVSDAKGVIGRSDDAKEELVLVDPSTPIEQINQILNDGKNLGFLPGQYLCSEAIRVTKSNTIIIGIGYATLNPTDGNPAIVVEDRAHGVRLCGLMIEAGQSLSDVLVEIGETSSPKSDQGDQNNPTILHDIFPRVGGPTDSAQAGVMLRINQSYCVVMHTWLWRADHTDTERAGLGIDKAKCDNALVVNGNNVRIFGLFAEHTLKEGIVWNGNDGMIQFLQSEMAYDVIKPWNYPMLLVKGNNFQGDALGVYSYFSRKHNNGESDKAPEVTTAIYTENTNASIINACTVFLNASEDPTTGGAGSISRVWNNNGVSSNRDNADIARWIENGKPCPALLEKKNLAF